MSAFEFRAVPAPRKGKSGKGVRGTPAKLANAMSALMNEMATDGWEYMRADTLPCEERQGLTGKTVKYHSMLVFRRPVEEVAAEIAEAAETLALPVPQEEVSEETSSEAIETAEETVADIDQEALPEPANDVADETAEKRETVAAE